MKVIVGKTEFTVALDAFIAIFIPKFVEINNSKFWVIISSYSIISVNELFSKCKTKIKDVVDLFHEVFPNDRFVTGLEAKKYPPYDNFKDTLRYVETDEIAWEEMESDVIKAECFEWVKNRVSSLTSQLDAVTRVVKRWSGE